MTCQSMLDRSDPIRPTTDDRPFFNFLRKDLRSAGVGFTDLRPTLNSQLRRDGFDGRHTSSSAAVSALCSGVPGPATSSQHRSVDDGRRLRGVFLFPGRGHICWSWC
jgi:hypothetical protein